MALIHMTYISPAIATGVDVNVVIPTPRNSEVVAGKDGYFHEGAKFPVLYLLHGTWSDYSEWVRRTRLELFCDRYKLIVVMPSGANSFFQDMEAGGQYFTYMTEELPRYMKTIFPISDKREETFIGGLSMGAYAAFNIALRRPDLYSHAIALSGGFDFLSQIILDKPQPWPWKAILPPPYDGRGTAMDDLPMLKEKVAAGVDLPKFYMAIGTEDFLYEAVQPSRKALAELGVDHVYVEGSGGHDWSFWDTYIEKAIAWTGLADSSKADKTAHMQI
jgi:putative tributyrin esterase